MSRLPLLPDRERPLVFAHRGCSSLTPENTFASFRKAREVGAPGLELDVHLTREGELVVAHDDNFLRTSPNAAAGARPIEEITRSEISGIDVGSFFDPAFAAERCPRLVDVLEEFCPDLYVDIELKTRKITGDALPRMTAGLLALLGSAVCASVTVSSFNPFALAAFKKAAQSRGGAVARVPTAVIYHVDQEVPWVLRRGAGRFLAAADYVKPHHSLA
ncbi:MAG: glycerophosphodiester phosphodiesterase, partial [Spirochaetaceae bacterium]|nr:glycerophosphodiester phosphodiesterase [Spirochaetaceae bacterium]